MNRKLVCGTAVLSLIILSAFMSPFFSADALTVNLAERLLPPSSFHLFGTDSLGRDLFSRVIAGSRLSLSIALLVCIISTAAGTAIGLMSRLGKNIDLILMRMCDGMKALPASLLAVLIILTLGGGRTGIVISLAIVNIPQTARLVRQRAVHIERQTFVDVQRLMGYSEMRILFTTVLRHVKSTLLIQSCFIFTSSIIAEAGLSFIGAGLEAGTPSWGNILREAKDVIYQAWWMTAFPAAFIFLTVLSLNIISDGLRERDSVKI